MTSKNTVDRGTQYTPPGSPPTSRPALATSEPDPTGLSADSKGTQTTYGSSSVLDGSILGLETDRQDQLEKRENKLEKPAHPSSPTHSTPPLEPHLTQTTVKVMPVQYKDCDIVDLGILISDMLIQLLLLNDPNPPKTSFTRFHSRQPPPVSVSDYLSRLIVHATPSPTILLTLVYLLDRLCQLYPAFTVNSLTIHRFLITAATVATKGLEDGYWQNSWYARIGGIKVEELAALELELLKRLEWRILPPAEALAAYYESLIERHTGYTIEERKQPADSNTSGLA